ncbi:MAG TPA: chemotaxis protein CheC [Gaiellaceae bacterium]
MKTYSELELDALRELANIGSGTAATALSQMLVRTIDVSVPKAAALPLAEAVETVGEPELVVTGVVLPIFGDLEALAVLLFESDDADRVCRLLGVEPGSEYGESALAEIGNILCSSYLGAVVSMTGLRLEPGPPQTAQDMLGAIVESVLAAHASGSDVALLLDSDLRIEDEESSFTFMLVPSAAGVAELLARLGLGG